MRQLKIKLCDDEQFYVEELYSLLKTFGNEAEYDLHIEQYTDVNQLIEDVINGHQECHLLFLDVEMPTMSGVDAGRKLRKEGYEGVICFVTSHESYAYDAYMVDALGYITKPAKYEALKRLLKRAVIEIFYQIDTEAAAKRYIEVPYQKGKRIVDLQKILYIEKRRNQSVIHLEDGELVCYETLKNLYGRLDHETFCYAHQGYIVNFDKIMEVLPNTIALGEGREIPVSRKYQKGLYERHWDMIHRLRDELKKK